MYTKYFYFRYIWKPWGWNNAFQHDAYSCKDFNGTVSWPTQRKLEPNNHIAAVVSDNMTLIEKCPME